MATPKIQRDVASALGAASWTFALSIALAVAGSASAQQNETQFEPTALEIVKLPPYCWATFNPEFRNMRGYHLPPRRLCGERINHYCPGLVALIRAKKDVRRRNFWLGVAADEIGYSLDSVRNKPNCPIREDMQRYANEVASMQKASRQR